MTGLRNKFGNQFNRISIIGSFFTLIWIVLTGIYIKNVLKTLRPIHIIGEDKEKTILDFGSVRPFFKVGGKNVIILENLTIRYSGSSSDFFDIEEAPGIILINIDFIQKKINSS